ncbi:hypothetical protein GEMRC1_014022 [Eukaryota sp. GEM-RC1]
MDSVPISQLEECQLSLERAASSIPNNALHGAVESMRKVVASIIPSLHTQAAFMTQLHDTVLYLEDQLFKTESQLENMRSSVLNNYYTSPSSIESHKVDAMVSQRYSKSPTSTIPSHIKEQLLMMDNELSALRRYRYIKESDDLLDVVSDSLLSEIEELHGQLEERNEYIDELRDQLSSLSEEERKSREKVSLLSRENGFLNSRYQLFTTVFDTCLTKIKANGFHGKIEPLLGNLSDQSKVDRSRGDLIGPCVSCEKIIMDFTIVDPCNSRSISNIFDDFSALEVAEKGKNTKYCHLINQLNVDRYNSFVFQPFAMSIYALRLGRTGAEIGATLCVGYHDVLKDVFVSATSTLTLKELIFADHHFFDPLSRIMHPPQTQGQQPQYQDKNNKKLFIIIGAALVAIAIIVVVVVFLLLGGDVEVHRSVVFTYEGEQFGFVYGSRIAYYADEDAEHVVKLDEDKVFKKLLDEDVCHSEAIDMWTQMELELLLFVVFPPKEFERDGSKTVGGTKCDIIKASMTSEGETHEAQWCVADGFVLEVGTGEDALILTDHKKVAEDSKYFDEGKLCDSIDPEESPVKTVLSPKVKAFASRFLKRTKFCCNVIYVYMYKFLFVRL